MPFAEEPGPPNADRFNPPVCRPERNTRDRKAARLAPGHGLQDPGSRRARHATAPRIPRGPRGPACLTGPGQGKAYEVLRDAVLKRQQADIGSALQVRAALREAQRIRNGRQGRPAPGARLVGAAL